MNITFRWFLRRDIEQAHAVECQCFRTPWRPQDFIDHLQPRNAIALVVEAPQHGPQPPVIGYVFYDLHKTKLHIGNLAVAPEWQRLGIGRQIIDRLYGKLSSQTMTRLTADCVESNLGGQLFFKATGFNCVNVLRGVYDDSDQDAYLFTRRYQLAEQTAHLELQTTK